MRPLRTVLAVATALAVVVGVPALASAAQGPAPSGGEQWTALGTPDPAVWRASGKDMPVRFGPPTGSLRAVTPDSPQTASFQVTYTGFTAPQRAAFQKAVDIWSRILVSSVPIRVEARLTSQPPGQLGSAGPSNVYSNGRSLYAAALADARNGSDISPGEFDISAEFNNDPGTIYFGTDGRPPSGTYDFPTIVLHELGHGLGFVGDLEVVNGVGTYDSGASRPTPFIFDRYVTRRTPSGNVLVIDYPRNSMAMGQALESRALFFGGANATTAGAGTSPELYAPAPYEPGSSIAHLDENTYPAGNANALMTPIADAREVSQGPGPLALGIMEDLGWRLSEAADPTPTASPSPSASASPSAAGSPPAGASPSASASPSGTAPASPSPSASFAPPPSPSPATSDGGSRYTALDPQRVLDTRDGTGVRTGRLGAGEFLDLEVTGRAGVPTSATAVVLNVTAVGATTSTDIRVYPTAGGDVPTVSNLNLAGGQTRANLVTVAVGPTGLVRLRNQSGSVHLVADVSGYYAPGASSTFFPLDPERLLDTRDGAGRLGPGQTRDLRVAGTTLVPGAATAVVLSVTAVGPTAPTDVRVYPTRAGGGVPTVSNLNIVPGGPVPNLVLARVGDAGSVRLRNNDGTVHLVVDVFGYYAAGSGGALFHPLAPTRLVDTRPGRLGAAELLDVDTGGGVPEGATAVALNVTGIGSSGETDVRVFPSPVTNSDPVPTVSTLNLVRGQTAAGAALVRTGRGTAVRVYNNDSSLAITVDVAGWFGPA